MKKQFLLLMVLVTTSIFSQSNYRTLLEQPDLTTGLVAYYKFDANSTDFVNAYNGTDTSISYSNAGVIGNCATFNGTSSLISIADQSNFSFTDGIGNDTAFTINFWVYLAASPGASGYWFINRRDGNTTPIEWQLALISGTLEFDLFQSSSIFILASVANPLTNTTWQMVTVTYSGSETAAGIKLYLNGTLLSTTNSMTGSYTGTTNTSSTMVIGKRGWQGNSFLNGRMDALAIYKGRELNQTELNALFQNGNGRPFPF